MSRQNMFLPFGCLLLSLLASVGANTPIYFGFVATDDTTSAELTPSLDIALSTINNSSSVLPGYQLSYVSWISEVRELLSNCKSQSHCCTQNRTNSP